VFRCRLLVHQCLEVVSPNGKLALYAEAHNLWVRPLGEDGGDLTQLTTDGEPNFGYGAEPEGRTTAIMEKRFGVRRPPSALWSPGSSKIVTHRLDEREVGEFHLVQGVPTEGHRPVHYSYRMAVPGDDAYPMESLVVIDVASGGKTAIDFEPMLADYVSAFTSREVWWSADGSRLYFIIRDRGDRRARLVKADPATGATRVIIDERSATHLDLSPDIYTMMMVGPTIRVLSERGEVIWFSERDGWGHLYLYDLATGKLKSQLTSGPWLVRGLVHVDEAAGRIWFVAGGREQGRDPYLRHLYSVNLDGSDLRLLSPEDADHDILAAKSGAFFVDNFSRTTSPP
jgi:dipeptidyl-peptidase-4